MAQIHEKLKELPEDVGEDFSKAESFHRMHAAFERDITALGKQVRRRGETRRAAAASQTLMIHICGPQEVMQHHSNREKKASPRRNQ